SSAQVEPYRKPAQPPPVTNTRRLRRSLPSSSISARTFATALSENCIAAGVKTSALDIQPPAAVPQHNKPAIIRLSDSFGQLLLNSRDAAWTSNPVPDPSPR